MWHTMGDAGKYDRSTVAAEIHAQRDFTITLRAEETFNLLILRHEERSNPKTVHFNLTGCILVAVLTTEIGCKFIYVKLSSFSMKSIVILLTRSA